MARARIRAIVTVALEYSTDVRKAESLYAVENDGEVVIRTALESLASHAANGRSMLAEVKRVELQEVMLEAKCEADGPFDTGGGSDRKSG